MRFLSKICAGVLSFLLISGVHAAGWDGGKGALTLQSSGPSFYKSFAFNNYGQPISPIGWCIGGEYCGGHARLTVNYVDNLFLPRWEYIQKIVITAHDNVGDRHKARLRVFTNGLLVAEKDVLAGGSTLTYNINAHIYSFYLESVREGLDEGGDETVITSITTY